MKLTQIFLMAAVVFSFLAGGSAPANGDEGATRAPSAHTGSKKKAGKPKKKMKKAGKKKAKKTAKGKGRASKANHAAGSSAKSHFPTQPNETGGLPELANEKKDDLPPPQNTEPKE